MLDKAPHNYVDPKAATELLLEGAKDMERLYGPAFTAKVIRHALKATRAKTREELPQNIKSLGELSTCLISKSNKLQTPPYHLADWTLNVTEKKLEGSLGVGYGMAF
jgi:hypothetical protein